MAEFMGPHRTTADRCIRRHSFRHHHGIVTRTAVHSMIRMAARVHRATEHLDQPRIHSNDRLIEAKLGRGHQSPACRDLLRGVEQMSHRLCAYVILTVAYIQTHADTTRDHVASSRFGFNFPDGRDQ